MKKIINIIAITISLIGFTYLVVSMLELSFNFADWREKARILLAIVSFMSLALSISFNNIKK